MLRFIPLPQLGLLNATYGGIGQSLGSLIGGSLSMRFGTAKAFLLYAGVDGLLLLAFGLFWGLHPNGQQRDRGAGGGIGGEGKGMERGEGEGEGEGMGDPPKTPVPKLEDLTFSPPSPMSQSQSQSPPPSAPR